jgi:hypothetical protein
MGDLTDKEERYLRRQISPVRPLPLSSTLPSDAPRLALREKTPREARPTTTRLHLCSLEPTSQVQPSARWCSAPRYSKRLTRLNPFKLGRVASQAPVLRVRPDIAKCLARPAPPFATHADRYHRRMLYMYVTQNRLSHYRSKPSRSSQYQQKPRSLKHTPCTRSSGGALASLVSKLTFV